jgi:hypothetical protein
MGLSIYTYVGYGIMAYDRENTDISAEMDELYTEQTHEAFSYFGEENRPPAIFRTGGSSDSEVFYLVVPETLIEGDIWECTEVESLEVTDAQRQAFLAYIAAEFGIEGVEPKWMLFGYFSH